MNLPLRIRALLLACLLAVVAPAHATLHVGFPGDPLCDFTSIQAAIDAAHPFEFVDIVTGTFSGQNLRVNGKSVFIFGGLNDCSGSQVTGKTTISGSGAPGNSVIAINGASMVTLGRLIISDGSLGGDNKGAGIFFGGSGSLDITDSEISNNSAGFGAGLNASPDGPTTIRIGPNAVIDNNTAQHSGGGIRVEGQTTLLINQVQTLIDFNHALDGDGGGINVVGPAHADIGSPGFLFPVIFGNDAPRGGGMSIIASTADDNLTPIVRLFTTDPNHPVTIQGNTASIAGGGVYLKPFNNAGGDSASAVLCAYNFRIVDNAAPDGTGIYGDEDTDFFGDGLDFSNVMLNSEGTGADNDVQCTQPPQGVQCAAGVPCNEISDNAAFQQNGTPTDGSAISMKGSSFLKANRVRMQRNSGGHVFFDGDPADFSINSFTNCLVSDNDINGDVMHVIGDRGGLFVDNCTLANNAVQAPFVLHDEGDFQLTNSIVFENKPTLQRSNNGFFKVDFVISNDVSTLGPPKSSVVVGNPLFVNAAANGDYHLQSTSPGIDVAPSEGHAGELDLDGNPREVQFAQRANLRDLGAFEHPAGCRKSDTLFCDGFDGP